MNSIKCKKCGLSNFASEVECRRCRTLFADAATKRRIEKKPRRFGVLSIAFFVLVAGILYYAYNGVQNSMNEINSSETNRIATQPLQQQTPGLSRTEYDRQRAAQVGNSLKENPSFAAQKQHNEETQKLMQSVSNSQPK
jgi:hypothetical protein